MKYLALLVALVSTAAQAVDYYVDNSPGQTYAQENGWFELTDTVYTSIPTNYLAEKGHKVYVAPGDHLVTGQLSIRSNLIAIDGDPEKTRLIGSDFITDGGSVTNETSIIFTETHALLCGFTVTNFTSSTTYCIGQGLGVISNCVIRKCKSIGADLTVLYLNSMRQSMVIDCETEDSSLIFITKNTTSADCLISNNLVRAKTCRDTVGIILSSGGKFYRFKFIGNRAICEMDNVNAEVSAAFSPHRIPNAYDCYFFDNLATNVYNVGTPVCNVGVASNSVIVGCTMPLSFTTLNLIHCVVSNCVGRPLCSNREGSICRNTLFVGNTLSIASQKGMTCGYFYNCTFADNKNTANSYGIIGQNTYAYNCITYDNYPADISAEVNNHVISNTLYGVATAENVKLTENNNIQSSTFKFNRGKYPELPYYALRSRNSPAVNKGDVTLNPIGNDVDLAGNPRINTEDGVGIIDLGCYEYYSINGGGFHVIIR